jgi:PilZ domain
MEHRWGERVSVDLRVEIQVGSRRRVPGRLRSASISGCQVDISSTCRLPHLTGVELIVAPAAALDEAIHLHGCIVRRTSRGFGIEWLDLSPAGLTVLLNQTLLTATDATPRLAARG